MPCSARRVPTPAPRRPPLGQRWRGSRNLLPALLFLGLFFFAPLIGLLLRGVLEPVPGLGNYEQLFANSAYARVLFNTFSWASRWPGRSPWCPRAGAAGC